MRFYIEGELTPYNVEGHSVKYVVDLPGCVPPYSEYIAFVTRDRSEDDDGSDGQAHLCILMDTKITNKYDVPYSAEKLPNTWHWIERWEPTKRHNVRNMRPWEMTATL